VPWRSCSIDGSLPDTRGTVRFAGQGLGHMAKTKREFRTQASRTAEQKSRNAVTPFLKSRGFIVEDDARPKTGIVESQFVTAIDPHGNQLKIHVRLCWRRHRGEGEKWYSAAQLRASLINDDWDKTLQTIEQRDTSRGVSHTLLVQSGDGDIDSAALIPTEALVPIWKGQREVCARLIAEGELGGIKKNINENGKSPTIYLIDTRTPSAQEIPDVLWNWPGVLDIAKLQVVSEKSVIVSDDTYYDYDIDLSLLGRDGTPRLVTKKSGVKRDPAVRREVVRRARGGCERSSCSDDRRYAGFLDLHHILGAEKSDRVWTCVALCPNCHRAAHFAPDRDALNEELLEFASQFRPATRT
jgi:5-methylcytosine-specific restriction enzyme A